MCDRGITEDEKKDLRPLTDKTEEVWLTELEYEALKESLKKIKKAFNDHPKFSRENPDLVETIQSLEKALEQYNHDK